MTPTLKIFAEKGNTAVTNRSRRTRMRSRHVSKVVALGLAAAAFTACGTPSARTTGATNSASSDLTSSNAPSATNNATDIAYLVPPDIRKAGVLRIAADETVAPFAFKGTDGNVNGIDVSICGDVAKHLGLKPEFVDTAFAGIIVALQANKFDATCSGMYIKPERAQVINFVPYLQTGISIMAASGNPHKISSMDGVCGLNVGVTLGSAEEALAKEQIKLCTDAGKPAPKIATFPGYAEAIVNLSGQRVDAVLGDDPTLAYDATKSPGSMIVKSGINSVEDGIGVNKNSIALAGAITAALYAMKWDGSYAADLKKWNITNDGLSTF